MVRGGGLEPPRLRIRPSNVRVYQFHHLRAELVKQKVIKTSTCLKMISSSKIKIYSKTSIILNTFIGGCILKSSILFLFLFIISQNTQAQNNSQFDQNAMNEAQKVLRSSSERQDVISKDQKAQQADQFASQAVGGDPALKNDVYNLSADILNHVMKVSGGDPAKAQTLLMKALKDPKQFMNSLPAAEQDKVREIANSVEKKKNPKP